MKTPIDLIHDHLVAALEVAKGIPTSGHQRCLEAALLHDVNTCRMMFVKGEERAAKARAS